MRLSALCVVLAMAVVLCEAFTNKAIFSLLLYVTSPNGLGFVYGITEEPERLPFDFEEVSYDNNQNITGELDVRRVVGPKYGFGRNEVEPPPTAKIELAVMLAPDISDFIDTAYASIEFCRLLDEAQELFDTIKERKVNVELSKLYYKENTSYTNYIDDNVIFEENGAIDVVGTLNDVSDVVDQWDQTYDMYLLLTRRPLVAVFRNKTIEDLTGYSVVGGACQPGKNIAVAHYSYKNIMHEITHLLGAVHADDRIPAGSECKEGDYTNRNIENGSYVRLVKGFANCTRDYMIDFLKSSNATCLYSEDILDYLDCDSEIPEIELDENDPPWIDLSETLEELYKSRSNKTSTN